MKDACASQSEITAFQELYSFEAEAGVACQANGLLALLRVVTQNSPGSDVPQLIQIDADDKLHVHFVMNHCAYSSGVTIHPDDDRYTAYDAKTLLAKGTDVTALIAYKALLELLGKITNSSQDTGIVGYIERFVETGYLDRKEVFYWLLVLSNPIHGEVEKMLGEQYED